MKEQFIKLDGVNWWVNELRQLTPLCPKHHLRLRSINSNLPKLLKCEECEKIYELPRPYNKEILYVIDKIDAKKFKEYKYINIDNEAIPIAEDKVSSDDNKFFVTARLIKSKVGLRLVVYAGEKGNKNKTQIFIEPEIKRLAFDQNDIHPLEIFTSVEATFSDNSVSNIKKYIKNK